LPRSARLRSGYQHAKVRSAGLSLHSAFFRFSCFAVEEGKETDEKSLTQGAVVVSRRVGSAVVRNKVKRRLREIYRQELPLLKQGLWIVVTAKPAAATATLLNLRSEWLRLAQRLSIFANL
jgi:ribonuclease P protein component